MDEFYAALKSGYNKNIALNLAKQHYLEQHPGKASHPFFWAGYMLVDTGPRPEPVNPPAVPKADAKDTKAGTPHAAKGKEMPAPVKPGEEGAKPASDEPK